MKQRSMTVFLLAVWLLAISTVEATSKKSIISCAFPDAWIALSVFSLNTSSGAQQLVARDEGLSFNAEAHPITGAVTYSSDVGGSNAIYMEGFSGSIADGPSVNDHARWDSTGTMLAFVSTREPNPIPNVGWTAVYTTTWSGSTFATPVRITPPNVSDMSPAWSPDGRYIAVASGSGYPNASDIVLINTATLQRATVATMGGWPTWRDNETVVFHRNGAALSEWSIVQVSIVSGEENTIAWNGLTPYINGNWLVYAAPDPKEFRQLILHDFSTGFDRQLTFDETHHYNPSISADGETVLFHRCRGGIWKNMRRKVSIDNSAWDVIFTNGDFPSVSGDGLRFSVTNHNFTGLSVMNIDGSNRTTIYSNASWMTSWANDTIAFTNGEAFQWGNNGSVQVATISPDGQNFKIVTHSDHHNQGYPSFSPNGSLFAFRTQKVYTGEGTGSEPRPGRYNLAYTDKTGTLGPIQITLPTGTGHMGDNHPAWGPNDVIAFMSDRGHPYRPTIWTVNVDGSNLKEIFDGGAASVHPFFTPDGSHIIFSSTLAGTNSELVSWPYVFTADAEIFSMTADGKNVTRLTHDFGEEANVWVGSTPIPETLSDEGLPVTCYYLDSLFKPHGNQGGNPTDPFHASKKRTDEDDVPELNVRRFMGETEKCPYAGPKKLTPEQRGCPFLNTFKRN